MISLLIQNTSTFISGLEKVADEKEREALKGGIRLRVSYEDAASIFRARKFKGDGRVSTLCYGRRWCRCKPFKKDGMHFPTGLLGKVVGFFKEKQISYEVIDQRLVVSTSNEFSVDPEECEERDYQQGIIDKGLRWGRGIVKLCTGGGKTSCAAQLIARLGAMPFIFFVPSKDLLQQAYKEFTRFIRRNGLPISVGRVGGGHRDIQDITVMTVQSAALALSPPDPAKKKRKKKKYDFEEEEIEDAGDEDELGEYRERVVELIRTCKGFICDEVQHWAAATCQLVANAATQARYRYGFSATPFRDKGDDMLIDACFGGLICDIGASFLIDHPKKYLVPPTIYFVPVENNRRTHFDDYDEAYDTSIVHNELRNTYACNIAKNLSDNGRMILILVKRIEHGEILERMLPGAVFVSGSDSGKIREQHIVAMREHRAPITIASTIFDEGIDVRPLDGVVLLGGGKSKVRAMQRVGRAIRPYSCDGYEKKDAIIVDFDDDVKWLRGHSKERRKMYATEPRFAIKDMKIAA
jgi:superfamily II DNA or RNA helicase